MQGFQMKAAEPVAAREDAGVVVELRDENWQPMTYVDAGGTTRPVTIKVAGTFSSIYRRAEEAYRDKLMSQRRAKATGAALFSQQLELMAACVLGWSGFFDGEVAVPCTKENALAILDRAAWIRSQVEEAMNDHAGFLPTSSPS